jgi:hypothetical protein
MNVGTSAFLLLFRKPSFRFIPGRPNGFTRLVQLQPLIDKREVKGVDVAMEADGRCELTIKSERGGEHLHITASNPWPPPDLTARGHRVGRHE